MIVIENKITGQLVGGPDGTPDTYESVEAAQRALESHAEVCGKEEVERLYRIIPDLEDELTEAMVEAGMFGPEE